MPTGIEQRKHRRYNLSLPVRVRSKTPAAPLIETATRDISAQGIYFALSEGVELGSELELEIALPPELCQGKTVQVRCRGKIARVERANSHGRIGVAVTIKHYEFVRID